MKSRMVKCLSQVLVVIILLTMFAPSVFATTGNMDYPWKGDGTYYNGSGKTLYLYDISIPSGSYFTVSNYWEHPVASNWDGNTYIEYHGDVTYKGVLYTDEICFCSKANTHATDNPDLSFK